MNTSAQKKTAFNSIEDFLLNTLNKAINKTLSYDPSSVRKLETFDDKIIRLQLDSTPFEFFLLVKNCEILVGRHSDREADTTIKGTPLALFAMNLDEPVKGIKNVEIYGDANIGQFFSKWLKTVQPDWEEAWCQILGDGMGVRVNKTIDNILNLAKSFRESLVNSTKDFLVEESRDLIAPAEMEQFLDDVDDLKADVSRLEQQINQLKSSA